LVDLQPWDFSFITSGLSVLGHSWDRAHARSETEVMMPFSKVYLYFKVTPGIAHMRAVKPFLKCDTSKGTASLGLSPYLYTSTTLVRYTPQTDIILLNFRAV
jgi:hypothetical protein